MTFKKIASATAAFLLAGAGIASAQGTTPGTPDTGAGDVAQNLFLLGSSAIVAVLGSMYLFRRARGG